ncbi:MAG: hypothetical protein ACOVQ2_03430, partial [Flavobacterium sp.]
AFGIVNAILEYKKEYYYEKVVVETNKNTETIEINEPFIENKTKNELIKKDDKSKNEPLKKDDKVTNEEHKDVIVSNEKNLDLSKINEKKVLKGEIIFKVQIKSSLKKLKLNDESFKGHKNVTYFDEKGTHKYYYFESNSLKEAKEKQKEAKEKGFKDAFIVGFKDSERVNIQQIKN